MRDRRGVGYAMLFVANAAVMLLLGTAHPPIDLAISLAVSWSFLAFVAVVLSAK